MLATFSMSGSKLGLVTVNKKFFFRLSYSDMEKVASMQAMLADNF